MLIIKKLFINCLIIYFYYYRFWSDGSFSIILLLGLCLSFGLVCLIFSSLITSCLCTFYNSIRAIIIAFCRCACKVDISSDEKPTNTREDFNLFKYCSRSKRSGLSKSSLNSQNYHLHPSAHPPLHGETLIQHQLIDPRSANIFDLKSSNHYHIYNTSSIGGGGTISRNDDELINDCDEPMIRPNSGSALMTSHNIASASSSSASSRARFVLSLNRTDSPGDGEEDEEDKDNSESQALMSDVTLHHPNQLASSYHPNNDYTINCTLRADARGLNGDHHLYECIPEDAYNNPMSMSSAFTKSYKQQQQLHLNTRKKMHQSNQAHHHHYHQYYHEADNESDTSKRQKLDTSSPINLNIMSTQNNLHTDMINNKLVNYDPHKLLQSIDGDKSLISFSGGRKGSSTRSMSSPRAERRAPQSGSLMMSTNSHKKSKNMYAKLRGNRVINSAISKEIV